MGFSSISSNSCCFEEERIGEGGLGGNETIFNSQWGLVVFFQIHVASRKRGLVCELTMWFRWK
jgi:hypothetical protein